MIVSLAACAADIPDQGERELGAWPLCEPSAALPLGDGALLVADNEGRKKQPTLWVIPAGGPPRPVVRTESTQDAESIVRRGDELWVLGSLSRNKDCESKKHRWEVHIHPFRTDALPTLRVLSRSEAEITRIERSPPDCVELLFGGLSDARPVCDAIATAPCPGLDVEGAAAIGDRVWVGLRSPLVQGRAVLARMVPDALAFDAVLTVDLGGRGIRELQVDGDRLYGIAGDPVTPSVLFSVPLDGLQGNGPGAGVLPVTLHDEALPPDAEAFELRDDHVRYLLDGATGDTRCTKPARQLIHPR